MVDVSERVQEALQERARQQHQQQWGNFINKYPIDLLFPAKVSSSHEDKSKRLKTNKDLINARLLENGILFEDLQSLPQLQQGVAQVVDNLMKTGCFENVELKVGKNSAEGGDSEHPHELEVLLKEKNWYSLYVGGGFKHEGIEESLNSPTRLPKAQFEVSTTFPNWTGHLDQTLLKYTVDQSATSSFWLSHERPLYAWMADQDSALVETLLALPKGSQYSLGIRAVMDTMDYEWTRSYQEQLRYIACRLDNTGRVQRPEAAPGYYWGLDWQLALRDVVPRKHATLPYASSASHEIVALSGPSLLHSLSWEVRTNGEYVNDRYQPLVGLDWSTKVELAGPPGDVGFFKAHGGAALHVPLVEDGSVALHGTVAGGYLRNIPFGGLCRPSTISDRFFVGGPMSLRGFLPAGIGPRSPNNKDHGSVSPGGDALGGRLYYTASLAASVAPPGVLGENGVRVFSFVNLGTLVGSPEGLPLATILRSTRQSVGAGISAATPMGRFEATYAWPIRYGPKDIRRNVQFGFGFHYG